MSSLLEIEEAADVLPIEEKKELVAFLLTRLRGVEDELLLSATFPRQPSTSGLLMTKRATGIFSQERENLSGYKRPSCRLSFQFWSLKSNS